MPDARVIRSEPPTGTDLGTGSAVEHITGTKLSPALGVEALIEYRGLLMNVRDWIDTYVVTGISGVDDADVRNSADPRPGRHGELPGSGLYGGRTIVLTIKIETKTIWKLRDMETALKKAFNNVNQEYPLYFRTNDVNKDVYINCRKSQKLEKSEAQDTDTSFVRTWQVTLRCSNPAFLSYLRQFKATSFTPTINYAPNPSFESGTTGAVAAGVTSLVNTGATLTQMPSPANVGSFGMRVVTTAASALQGFTENLGILPAGTYTFSVAIMGNVGGETIQVFGGKSGVAPTLVDFVATTSWVRGVVTFVADGINSFYIGVRSKTAQVLTFYVDALLVNTGIAPLAYFDGASGGLARWLGTANTSLSYRDDTVSQKVDIKSTIDTDVILEITGPVTNFVASDANNPLDAFRLTGTVPALATYVYDSSIGTLVDKSTGLDKSSLIADDSGDGLIRDNTTAIDYSGTGRDPNSNVNLFWRHSYG